MPDVFRVRCSGFSVRGSLFSVQCSGFRVQGSGFGGLIVSANACVLDNKIIIK